LNSRTLVALTAVVIVLLAGTLFVAMQLGTTAGGSKTQSSSTASTTVQTSGSYTNSSQNLQLQLSVNASSTGGPQGNVTVSIAVDEYNALATTNNVSIGCNASCSAAISSIIAWSIASRPAVSTMSTSW